MNDFDRFKDKIMVSSTIFVLIISIFYTILFRDISDFIAIGFLIVSLILYKYKFIKIGYAVSLIPLTFLTHYFSYIYKDHNILYCIVIPIIIISICYKSKYLWIYSLINIVAINLVWLIAKNKNIIDLIIYNDTTGVNVVTLNLILIVLIVQIVSNKFKELYLKLDRKYHEIFDNISEGFAHHQVIIQNNKLVDCVYLDVNSGFERILGLKKENIIGKSIKEIIPNIDGIWFDRYKDVVINKKSIEFEDYSEVLKKHFKVMAFSPSEGQFITIFSDITDKKIIEEQIKNNEAQNRAILNAITTNIAFVNDKLEIIWLNKTAADSVNKTLEELIGKTCYSLWANPEVPCDNCPTVVAFKTKKTEHFLMNTPDGRIWDEKGEPVFDNDGNLIGVVEIANDITDIKKMEKELRENEEKYRLLIENINDVIWKFDPFKNKFIYISPTIKNLRGLSVEEAMKETMEKSLVAESYEYIKNQLPLRIKDFYDGINKNYIDLVKQKCKNGNIISVEISSSFIVDENNQIKEILGISRDVSERVKIEEELIEAKNKAEENEKLKSEFIRNVSHELRNPMNGIIGFCQLILKRTKNPKMFCESCKNYNLQEECTNDCIIDVNYIYESSLYLKQIINDILDLSKIESGKINVEKENFDLKDFIFNDIFVSFSPLASEKNINLVFKNSEDISSINTDKKLLKQILTNLIGNAIKFTNDKGNISIDINKDVNFLIFKIKDDGIGIPKEKQKYLFKPFVQVDGSMTREFEGTGLGLAISKKLVNLLGGDIGLESEINEGSTFYFSIK